MFWIEAAWNYLFGWAGVDFLVGVAFTALAVLVPPGVAALVPDLRKTAIAVAVVAFTCMGCIAYGHKSGIDFTRAQWAAALQREAGNGEAARSDLERSIPRTDDRRMFDNDPDNRDRDGEQQRTGTQGALRRLAPHSLLGK
jgi:hypothetical protein